MFKIIALMFSLTTLVHASCDIDVYIPAIEYSQELSEQEVIGELEEKGYSSIQFISVPADSAASYYLAFDESGVFPIAFKASAVLVNQQGKIIFHKEKRTFGRDQFIFYKKLLKKVPMCSAD